MNLDTKERQLPFGFLIGTDLTLDTVFDCLSSWQMVKTLPPVNMVLGNMTFLAKNLHNTSYQYILIFFQVHPFQGRRFICEAQSRPALLQGGPNGVAELAGPDCC